MMKRFARTLLVAALLVLGLSVLSPARSFAVDPLAEACANGSLSSDSATCKSLAQTDSTGKKQNPLTGTNGVLYKISMLIATIAGITAVIVIIASGMSFITSGGDAQKAAKARGNLIGALLGLVIIVMAQGIILFVIGKL